MPSWLATAQHLLGGGPHNTRLLLRQDQLAQARCPELVSLAVVRDQYMSVSLQQRVAAHHARLAMFARMAYRTRLRRKY